MSVSNSHQNTLTKKPSSLTEELSSIPVERAKVCAHVNGFTARLQRMKEDVGNSLSKVSTKAKKIYDDMHDANQQEIQEHVVDDKKN